MEGSSTPEGPPDPPDDGSGAPPPGGAPPGPTDDADDPLEHAGSLDGSSTDTIWLVKRHREGSSEAAGKLFDKHLPRLRRIASARLGPTNPLRQSMDSQDLAQEALLKAYRNLEHLKVEEKGQFVAWVARIIENTLRDAAAAQRTLKRDLDRRTRNGESDSRLLGAVPDRAPEPVEAVLDRERGERLLAAFESLDERSRELLVLRREGHTFREIAVLVGLPTEDTARGHFQRAVSEVRRRFDG